VAIATQSVNEVVALTTRDIIMTAAKKTSRARSPAKPEHGVVYRGIKIAPISGKRSATAQAIREVLRTKSEQSHGDISVPGNTGLQDYRRIAGLR
jgi:hypothetical protein